VRGAEVALPVGRVVEMLRIIGVNRLRTAATSRHSGLKLPHAAVGAKGYGALRASLAIRHRRAVALHGRSGARTIALVCIAPLARMRSPRSAVIEDRGGGQGRGEYERRASRRPESEEAAETATAGLAMLQLVVVHSAGERRRPAPAPQPARKATSDPVAELGIDVPVDVAAALACVDLHVYWQAVKLPLGAVGDAIVDESDARRPGHS
jgi:hypothetical protein